jgi:hypothetical protein
MAFQSLEIVLATATIPSILISYRRFQGKKFLPKQNEKKTSHSFQFFRYPFEGGPSEGNAANKIFCRFETLNLFQRTCAVYDYP